MKDHLLKILMVEDDADYSDLLEKRLVQSHDGKVVTKKAGSLGAALDDLKNERFDLVLLDLSLPDSFGLDTIAAIRLCDPAVAILVLTSFHAEMLAIHAVSEGAQDYLLKEEITGDVLWRSIQFAITRNRILSQWKQAYRQEYYQATHDPLTHLPNRLFFDDLLQQAFVEAERRHAGVGVLFMDLDQFKQINDTFGHDTGDQLLKSVGKRIMSCLREEDTIARVGGDEFTALLRGVHQPEDLVVVAQRILRSFSKPFLIDGRRFDVTVSIGISFHQDDAQDIFALMKHADLAMYEAKSAGKNTYHFYKDSVLTEGTNSTSRP